MCIEPGGWIPAVSGETCIQARTRSCSGNVEERADGRVRVEGGVGFRWIVALGSLLDEGFDKAQIGGVAAEGTVQPGDFGAVGVAEEAVGPGALIGRGGVFFAVGAGNEDSAGVEFVREEKVASMAEMSSGSLTWPRRSEPLSVPSLMSV
jgi:hypothetical protein